MNKHLNETNTAIGVLILVGLTILFFIIYIVYIKCKQPKPLLGKDFYLLKY